MRLFLIAFFIVCFELFALDNDQQNMIEDFWVEIGHDDTETFKKAIERVFSPNFDKFFVLFEKIGRNGNIDKIINLAEESARHKRFIQGALLMIKGAMGRYQELFLAIPCEDQN